MIIHQPFRRHSLKSKPSDIHWFSARYALTFEEKDGFSLCVVLGCVTLFLLSWGERVAGHLSEFFFSLHISKSHLASILENDA